MAATTSSVGVSVDLLEGLSPPDRSFLLETVASAIEQETGRAVVLNDSGATTDEFAAAIGSDSVVEVSMTVGARLARLALRLHSTSSQRVTVQLDVNRDRSAWGPRVAGAVRALLPLAKPTPQLVPPLVEDVAAERPTWPGWLGLGVGAAAIGVGIGALLVADARYDDAERFRMQHDEATSTPARAMLRTDAESSASAGADFDLVAAGSMILGALLTGAASVYLGLAR